MAICGWRAAFISAPCPQVDEVLGYGEFPRMLRPRKPSCVGRDSPGRKVGSGAPLLQRSRFPAALSGNPDSWHAGSLAHRWGVLSCTGNWKPYSCISRGRALHAGDSRSPGVLLLLLPTLLCPSLKGRMKTCGASSLLFYGCIEIVSFHLSM